MLKHSCWLTWNLSSNPYSAGGLCNGCNGCPTRDISYPILGQTGITPTVYTISICIIHILHYTCILFGILTSLSPCKFIYYSSVQGFCFRRSILQFAFSDRKCLKIKGLVDILIMIFARFKIEDKIDSRAYASLFFSMMTSSNGNIFRVTGLLCREFTGQLVNSPQKGQWRGALMFSLMYAWTNGWVNNRDAGDLIRYHSHCDVTLMRVV